MMNYLKKEMIAVIMLSGFICSAHTTCAVAEGLAPEPLAQTATGQIDNGGTGESSQPRFTVLPDKISSISDHLSKQNPVHYYGFVALRGQDILLSTPGNAMPYKNPWKIEYRENDEWKQLTSEEVVFSGLQPGHEMIVRVSPAVPGEVPAGSYNLAFGSLPVLKYDLHDEAGVIRISGGRTVPAWLATQAYKQALLDVRFTDSKNVPLAGGVAAFSLGYKEHVRPEIRFSLISDEKGQASKMVELGRCTGGYEAESFVHKQQGFNTWKSHYLVAGYSASNALRSSKAEQPHVFFLGHICSQKLVKSVRPNN
ncbi:putative uncharacterized protein [Pseudomonas sp. StFLB209]|nr:putative uncharacterized protein [Pseudomonas sp. StFLB209]